MDSLVTDRVSSHKNARARKYTLSHKRARIHTYRLFICIICHPILKPVYFRSYIYIIPCLFIIFIGREGSHFGCASVAPHTYTHTYNPHHFSLTFSVLILFLFHLLQLYFFMSKCMCVCVCVAAHAINENNKHVHVKYTHWQPLMDFNTDNYFECCSHLS